jgi:hypothetical protein
MAIRIIDVDVLQPSDLLRVQSQAYLETLNINEIKERHGLPQVWEVDGSFIISDGNQRAANLAKRGVKVIEVDYQGTQIKDYFLDFLNLVVSRAEALRKQGIYTPRDLWH